MWPFKRKKSKSENKQSGLSCVHCGSTDTAVISDTQSESPNYIRVWRGKRYVTCMCRMCGQVFYSDESEGEITDEYLDDNMIEDEEQLRMAEEDLRRRTDADDDRRYLPGGF